ncbi:MAG: LacI family DNA-binding transcriptional regulator [Gemmiger sp.]|nr:LacI family DNA-binding transcriptional regulator [Gemmiger sp.]
MATIKDVANEAKVAISTVSNALNGVPVVNPQTRERILKIAEEMNYHPNINAKLMKSRCTQNIGLFLPAIHSEFYIRLMQAMYPVCEKRQYSLQVNICASHENKMLISQILAANVDAAAILNENLQQEDYDRLEASGVPFVFLDHLSLNKNKRMSCILLENESAILSALEYLVQTGHKSVGFLRGTRNYDGDTRYHTFVEGSEQLHLAVPPAFVLDGYFEECAAYNAIRGALATGNMPPDAILCSNDKMAVGCINALQDAGFQVPGNVSVIGFDDIECYNGANAPLTTLHIPIEEIGREVAEELFRLLDDENACGQSLRKPCSLVIGHTTRLRYPGTLQSR